MEIDGGDDPVPNEVREYTSAKPNLIKFLIKTMGYGLDRSPFFVWGGIWGGK